MRIKLTLISLLILSLSCKKEIQKKVVENVSPIKKTSIQVIQPIITDSVSSDLYVLFSNNKKNITQLLPTLSREKANYLYDAYIEENNLLLNRITDQEISVLDGFYSEESKARKSTALLKEKLKKYDLIMEEIGEGMVIITTKPDYYYTLFSDYVSNDYKTYIQIQSEENKTIYQADAGLAISFNSLGKRIVLWEKFITKYPNSNLLAAVKNNYKNYQLDYVLGLDNTPTLSYMEDTERYIYPENLKEFEIFTKNNPKSPTVKLITLFKENYQKENIRDLIIQAQK